MSRDRVIVDAGYLRGVNADDPALTRILAMEEDLAELLVERKPEMLLIEISTGKVNRKRHKGGGAGLSTYGVAAGAMWRTARDIVGTERVITVDESWTLGVPKKIRAGRIAMGYPKYKAAMELDGGGDVADAIGIGLWWINQQQVKGLLAG